MNLVGMLAYRIFARPRSTTAISPHVNPMLLGEIVSVGLQSEKQLYEYHKFWVLILTAEGKLITEDSNNLIVKNPEIPLR